MTRDAATRSQIRAADPGNSTWLSANAGSGKTRVLTDRVARLLLNGVRPQHVLCLTYTKAAASEMQNRLFRRLGEWAMLEDGALRARLGELGVEDALTDADLRSARRLFARAIETPGGLRIQTIHSFCAGLLRRFPLEAGVSPQFVEMDERTAHALRQEVLEEMAQGAEAAALDSAIAHLSGEDLVGFAEEVARNRADFAARPDAAAIWKLFGLPPGHSESDILAAAFNGEEAAILATLLPALQSGSPNDQKAAARLSPLDLGAPKVADLEILEGLLLYGKGAIKKGPFSAKIGSFPTQGTRDAVAGIIPALEDFMRRVEDARPRRLALLAAQKTLALHSFAATFLPLYENRKLRNGWLDFDDLILKTRELLTEPGVAEWVLYRLDGGIDHILVDEAQDTSPEQWQVIDLLTREFTAGAGARDAVERTVFVVGDKKQSIYSFQGADPGKFDEMQKTFGERLKSVSKTLKTEKLEYSFRSSTAVLGAVDNTFHEAAREGVGSDFLHRAFHGDMPGRVDLWPVVGKSDEPEEGDWTDPVDMIPEAHHDLRLARRISGEIRRMIDEGETLWQKQDGKVSRRPVRAGDFMILVQRRAPLFHEIIRACKADGLPIAGADRLKIGGELAVKDLTALLSFLALPEDSLSLAAALRSPLFGWDEAQLFDLAAGRQEKFLWERLRKRREACPETFGMLDSLLDDADFLRPYDLLARILTRHDGRRRLVARLGPEAEDGIDALLNQALAYERVEVPGLTGFLVWLETEEVEIKRQLDAAGDRIRVMTVHGAKGLEAPVVILPDTGKRQIMLRDNVLIADGGVPIWSTTADQSPGLVADAREAAMRRQNEERQRLLYVAMTRAEQWLITCAAGDLGTGDTWYGRIGEGMQRAGAVAHDFPFGRGLRLEVGDWGLATVAEKAPGVAALPPVPGWAAQAAETPERPARPLSPSDLGGAKALAGGEGLDEEAAKLRGSRLHLLLEKLPGHDTVHWREVAHALLAGAAPAPSEPEIEALVAEAAAVLTAPETAELFARPAMAEVSLTAAIPALGGARLSGAVDRLIVESDRVLAIDFKSNAAVPERAEDVPEGILRQMGAYAAALAEIYPGREIGTAILWTRTARLMPLPSQLVALALARATTS